MINIYNFLADSFKYNRSDDVGYLIARFFLNKDMHYFVEGKKQLGFLYNDFDHAVLDRQAAKAVIESTILYCLNFDLFTPPYDEVHQLSVKDMIETTNSVGFSTGKRLGFRFLSEQDKIT